MKPSEGNTTPGSARVVVLTDNDALWSGLQEESRDHDVRLERGSRGPEAFTEIQALIVDGRAGFRPWMEVIRGLGRIIPIVAIAPHGVWDDRQTIADVEHVNILPAGQADLLEQTLAAIERFRARPRIAAVTAQDLLRQKLLTCFGTNVASYPAVSALWASLEDEIPDVFVVDLQSCRSFEPLASALRQDLRTARAAIFAVAWGSEVSSSFDEVLSPEADEAVLKGKILYRFRRTLGVRRLIDNDPMTGLANRRRARSRVNFFLRLGNRQKVPVSASVLDLDNFKGINDTYGHGVGDRVIKRLARLLRHSFRLEDVTARLGGEEFMVASYGIGAAVLAERLRQVLKTFSSREFRLPAAGSFRVTFSAGVAEMGRDGDEFQALYEAADLALYQAKKQGRNQIRTTHVEGID